MRESSETTRSRRRAFAAGLAFFLVVMAASPAAADFVIADDLIVNGGSSSACVGFDCVNGENFGFDTMRLKENNLRLKFEDTSTGSFPSNDWELTANDSANGGQNRFSITDVTGSRTPFTVEAGAAHNSVYVDSSSRVGFRTPTPVLDLHVNNSNTPGLRFEQNGSGGFTPQTWDMAGNEANFFIRDVTSGSRLPFRIRPGAPTSSIDIAANGDVGMGTASPVSPLHVARTDGRAQITVEENSTTDASRTLLDIRNNGATFARFMKRQAGANTVWRNGVLNNDSFTIDSPDAGPRDMELDMAGNMTIGGSLTQLSDRRLKRDIVPADGQSVLAKLAKLPVSTWSYDHDPSGAKHIGPMAQDFYAAFGFGSRPRYVAPGDLAGVALAGIQELLDRQGETADEVERLRERNRSLEQRIEALEGAIGAD